MKLKIIVFAITLSLLISGLLAAVGGEATEGEESDCEALHFFQTITVINLLL